MIQIAPSLLSADFSKLTTEIKNIEKHVDLFHFDVMDGHFVPNLTYGPSLLETVHGITKKPIDAHLMITNPNKFVQQFVDAGAAMVSVHVEAPVALGPVLGKIRNAGAKAGIALNPSTPFSTVTSLLDKADYLLFMTVNPGFGGQSFIHSVLPKIRQAKKLIAEQGLNIPIEVDGGINQQTGKQAVNAGAEILVAGSYIFNSKNPIKKIKELKK